MELSVIIPCRNAGATIATQLEALANQWWSKPWEIIISDNGSTDNFMSIVNQYKERLPNLRIIDSSAQKKSSAYARNAAVRASTARAVAFCDADDEVAPGWLGAIGEALLQHDAVHGQMCFDKFNSSDQTQYWSPLWKDGLYRQQYLPHAAGCNLGVRRSVHESIGGFDECLPRNMDADYSWRLQLEGYKFYYVPEAIYQYRIARSDSSLPYLFRRTWTSVASDWWLYKKFRPLGVTKNMIFPSRLSMKRSLLSWVRLLRNLPSTCFRGESGRATWSKQFVQVTGELVGQCWGGLTNPCTTYRIKTNR